MTRRNKLRLANGWIGTVSRLPWWLGVALALLSFLLLHALAQRSWSGSMPAGLIMAGQYALPIIFLLAAALSAFQRRKAVPGHDAATSPADGAAYMKWRDFEILVSEYFRRQGFRLLAHGGGAAEGGADMLVQQGANRYLVQCRHWRAPRVDVQPVREWHDVVAAGRVAGGFVVTSGEFTDEARHFSEGRGLQLIDGKALLRGIRVQTPLQAPPQIAEPAVRHWPVCPLCSAEMVLRQVRGGSHSGTRFWGCSRYAETRCQGTRKVA